MKKNQQVDAIKQNKEIKNSGDSGTFDALRAAEIKGKSSTKWSNK
jgi:hypothetical protein